MTTSKSIHRSVAILKLPKSVPLLVTYAQGIVTAMTGNAAFTSPDPPLATVTTAISALQTAQTVMTRSKGATAARNDKRVALVTLLERLKGYVQITADADVENSAAIVQSAGMIVRRTPLRTALAFHAKEGAVSGAVKLLAPRAGRYSFYEWQYSTDVGKTWTAWSASLQAKTTVTGLLPGSTVLFRYRPGTKAGEGDWSGAIAFLVR